MENLKKAISEANNTTSDGYGYKSLDLDTVDTLVKYAQMLVDCKGMPEKTFEFVNNKKDKPHLYTSEMARNMAIDACTIAHVASQAKLLEENKRLRNHLKNAIALLNSNYCQIDTEDIKELTDALTKEEGGRRKDEDK